jgi:hypothetical protein
MGDVAAGAGVAAATFDTMSRLRPYPVLALAAWSLFLWTSRLGLAWKTAGSTASKVLATVPVVLFVALGLALLAVLLRRPPDEARAGRLSGNGRLLVLGAAGWTVAYWLVRIPMILTDGRSGAFHAVHAVLATVSIGLAAWAWHAVRRPAEVAEPLVVG